MKNPFHVLGLPEDADDEMIKKAWLRLVRQHPPERDPDRFQEIRSAYETIASRRDRLRYQLFHTSKPDPAHLCRHLFENTNPGRSSAQLILDTLADDLKHFHLATPGKRSAVSSTGE